jgi:hypothetical protein
MKAERLIVVPETADDLRAAITALRYLDVSKGVSFHTSLPKERCMRLLIKNVGKRMPETVVREELEVVGICVHGILQLRSGAGTTTPKSTALRPHTLLCRWHAVLM